MKVLEYFYTRGFNLVSFIAVTREEVEEFLKARRKRKGEIKIQRASKDIDFDMHTSSEGSARVPRHGRQVDQFNKSVEEQDDDVQFGRMAPEKLEKFYREQDLDDGKSVSFYYSRIISHQ